jgi:hypothetical protein
MDKNKKMPRRGSNMPWVSERSWGRSGFDISWPSGRPQWESGSKRLKVWIPIDVRGGKRFHRGEPAERCKLFGLLGLLLHWTLVFKKI